jgi:hypothetical protein
MRHRAVPTGAVEHKTASRRRPSTLTGLTGEEEAQAVLLVRQLRLKAGT